MNSYRLFKNCSTKLQLNRIVKRNYSTVSNEPSRFPIKTVILSSLIYMYGNNLSNCGGNSSAGFYCHVCFEDIDQCEC